MDLSEEIIVKSSRLKSVVWNDFDRVKKGDTFVAICRHCKRKLSGSSASGTSHLRNHLIRCQRRSNHGIGQCLSVREKRKDGALVLGNVNIEPEQESNEPEQISIVDYRYQQLRLKDDAVHIATNNLDQRRSQFDLAHMIILHGYPLDIVEHVGFRVFVRNLQPLFELVTSEKVEANCMEIYANEKQKVYENLDKFHGKISLSADLWAASEDSQYLCLMAHYIDEAWQSKKKILNFIPVDPSHTADMHSELIMASLVDWDIDRKLFSITSDMFPANDNIIYRIRGRLSQNRFLLCNGQLFDIRCAVDLLNLMVYDALEALFETTYKIRASIRYVKSSRLTQVKFSKMVSQAGVQSQKCLCSDNPSWWESTHAMLEVACEYRGAFSILQEDDPAQAIGLSDLEWDRAKAVTDWLSRIAESKNFFMKSKYPTANIYFPEICSIHLSLIDWCKMSDGFISSIAKKMKSRFDDYWDKCNLALAAAVMLDPRFKMKVIEYYYPQLFGSGSAELIDEVSEYIKALYNEHSIGSPLASLEEDLACQVNGSAGCLPSCGGESKDRLMGFDKFLTEGTQSECFKSDLDKYLEEPLFPRGPPTDFNILNWWKVHTPRYPILSMMARNILGIPMSKVTLEPSFKNGGRVLDRDGVSLQPSTVQALMCSQDWMRSETNS
uniref:Uncharacterized protein MANES_01G128600 n=1 Tax=Rhizophora mucronata TaxID=61149 RepID=A0A2P2J8B2_RHIMU